MKNMKQMVVVILAILGIAIAFAAGRMIQDKVRSPGRIDFKSDLKIDRLEELSELVSLRVRVSDVLCAETQGVRAAFLIAGDALISVDMGQAQITEQDTGNHTAVILLPAPAVLNARVDHRRTLTYDVQTGLFTSSRTESRVRDEAMGKAQALVEAAAESADNIILAKGNAEKTLRLLFKQLGWDVEIRWRGQDNDKGKGKGACDAKADIR